MDISSIISSGIGSLANGIGSIINSKAQEKITDKLIASQKEANERNIASQERINQMNIDNTNMNNALMRQDAHNAISIKKRDLINAGYSTADPNLTGSSFASLTNPSLQASHVDPEYNEAMAQIDSNAVTSLSNSLLDGAKIMSEIKLNEANAKSSNANAESTEINNKWLDAQLSVNYDISLESLNNLKKDGKIKDKEFEKYEKEFNLLDNQINLISEQYLGLVFDNQFKPYRYTTELRKLNKEIINLQSDIDIKEVDKGIKKFEKRLKEIEVDFAEIGINFNSNDLVTAIARIVGSPRGHEVFTIASQFLSNSIDEITNNTIDNLVDTGKKVLKKSTQYAPVQVLISKAKKQ